MTFENQLLINKYGQDLINLEPLLELYNEFNFDKKRGFLADLSYLIQQSKPKFEDIDIVIKELNLKPTYTPCIIIKKGFSDNNLRRVVNLPESELLKTFKLFLGLFKIAYNRRFFLEKGDPNKWWYWDLSNQNNEETIKRIHFSN